MSQASFFRQFIAAYRVRNGAAVRLRAYAQDGTALFPGYVPDAAAPVVTADPTISGTTDPTGVLTLAEGTATGNPTPTGSVQWYIGGAAISGQTGLTIDKAVHGPGSYSATVTWSNGIAPNASRTSNVIAAVEAPPSIQRVVVIGASIMNSLAGNNLTTPHAGATTALGMDVYGGSRAGETLSEQIDNVQSAIAAFPTVGETVFLLHSGGNDVSAHMPFDAVSPATLDTMRANLNALLDAFGAHLPHVVAMPPSFRSYTGQGYAARELFNDQMRGALGFNEAVFKPIYQTRIAPRWRYADGESVMCFYDLVRNNFEDWLTDGIHISWNADRRSALLGRLGQALAGTTPTRITPDPVDPVAPVVQTMPAISPSSGPVGTVFTLTYATFGGTPQPTPTHTLTQAGSDVTAQISGGQFISTTEGALVWTATATTTTGTATEVANATVTAAGETQNVTFLNFVSAAVGTAGMSEYVISRANGITVGPSINLLTFAGVDTGWNYHPESPDGVTPTNQIGANLATIDGGTAFDGTTIYCLEAFDTTLFTTHPNNLVHVFDGLTPGASYQLQFVGSRSGATVRTSRFQVEGGGFVDAVSNDNPPTATAIVDAVADGGGRIRVLQSSQSANFSYVSGISITELAPVATTATPATMSSPDAWPTTGSTVTITKGTSDGTPIGGVLTLAGVDVTGDATDTGPTLVYVVSAGGSTDRTLTWTPVSGAVVSLTIKPALGLVTTIRVDQNAARTGTDTAVTGVTGNGTLAEAWSVTGTGAEVQKVSNGWQFGGGKYLQAASGLPAGNYSGGAIVLRARATAIPAASATVFQLDSTAGSRITISQTTAGAWVASTNGASGANTSYLIPSDVAVGGDILIGLEWDYNGGASRSRLIGMDGYAGDWIAASSTVFLELNQMRVGQNFVGTVEIVAATLRPDGGTYPIQPLDLWQRVANKQIEDRAALDAGPVQIIDGGGQSLWLGYQVPQPQRDHINLGDRAGVRIPAGLVSTTGSPINTSMGSTNNDLNQAVPATGLMPAAVATFGPVQHYMLVALRKRRALLGLPNPQLVSLGHGISGQSIDEFDDDTPLTGALGLRIQNNRQYMTQQAWAVTAGRTRSYPYSLWAQGEADANDTPGTYYPALMELLKNWGDHVEATTGQRPTPMVTQIGTYINQPGHNYAVRREQVQACLDSGGILGGPWYQFPVVDNTIHPGVTETMLMGDTLAWAITEVEQGNGWPALIPTAVRDGADLVLTYPEPMALHGAAKYAPYGGVTDAGFHGAGAISGVAATGNTIRLTTAATSWRYAEQNYNTSGFQSGGLNYGPSRGLVRAARTVPSVLVPGETLYRFAPAWSGAV